MMATHHLTSKTGRAAPAHFTPVFPCFMGQAVQKPDSTALLLRDQRRFSVSGRSSGRKPAQAGIGIYINN